ncbi:MAG: hypothetical protein FWC27_14355, partial [Firmicutes bacterium]|nr:hypothetical protein [Bacillota bacterium]
FAALMNARAREAGALDTNFVNANGLNNANHYTTAYDMARITLEAIKNPAFKEIFGALSYNIPPTNKQPQARALHCTNLMKRGRYQYEGIVAAKTGWTRQAKHTLMTVAERDGRTLIGVVMKSGGKRDRWEDMTELLDYGFENFTQISFSAEELRREGISAEQGFSCLIPSALTKADVDIAYTTAAGAQGEPAVKAVFTLKAHGYYAALGELEMQAAQPVNADVAGETKDPADASAQKKSLKPWIVSIAGLILACLVSGFLVKKRRQARRRPTGNITIRLNQTPAGYALHAGKMRRRRR